MEPTTWAWLVVALVLYGAEILSPGFIALPFALGATAAALLDLAGVDMAWQWFAFVGLSSAVLVIAQRVIAARRQRAGRH